jgi:hypothetical protein
MVRTLVMRVRDGRDLLLLASLYAVLHGVSQWSRPLAWVIGGALGLVVWSVPYWRRTERV